MKATRHSDGTYSLTGMSWMEALDLFQFVYDQASSARSSGDELDESEERVYLRVYDLKDLVVEDVME